MTNKNAIDNEAPTSSENKKKYEKAEDFIGWKSPDGKLEVIGIAGKQGYISTFKVICTECSKDKELFPDGYFVHPLETVSSVDFFNIVRVVVLAAVTVKKVGAMHGANSTRL